MAHINSVLEGLRVTRGLERCRSRNTLFSANAAGKNIKVLVEVINGSGEVSKDSVVF